MLFQTQDQFEYDGCENCDEFLRMKNNRENVYDCTSSNFDGYVYPYFHYISLNIRAIKIWLIWTNITITEW